MWATISLPGTRLTRDPETKKKLLNDSRDLHIPPWKDEKSLSTSLLIPQDRVTLIHTGKSQLTVLDFDSDLFLTAVAINSALPASERCTLISENIGKPGGHFYYRYSENALTAQMGPNGLKRSSLDTLIGSTLVFATNIPNETKKQIAQVATTDELIHMPLIMQSLAIGHYVSHGYQPANLDNPTATAATANRHSSKLGIVAQQATRAPDDLLRLLGIITTAHWKHVLADQQTDLPANHPDRLPDGESAHMYLVSLANVLRLDPSVDEETYMDLLFQINELFSSPLNLDRVGTIISADKRDFVYNPNWETDTLIFSTRQDELLEIFKLSRRGSVGFMIYNSTTSKLTYMDTSNAVGSWLMSEIGERLKKDQLDSQACAVELIAHPSQPFGHSPDGGTFNTYQWNDSQSVFYQPAAYATRYARPDTTLRALESAIGPQLHTHFLPFLRRKLMTWEHSPLFFVLHGVPHSFKSGLFHGVLGPLTPHRNLAIEVETGTEKFNDWQVNKDFIFLDEAHHILSADLRRLIKVFNTVGGSETLSGIRAMHQSTSSEEYPNEMTFIIATNEEIKLTTEVGERRMVVFTSNTQLTTALGMPDEEIRSRIRAEELDFAYYLSTQVTNLPLDQYRHNRDWRNAAYEEMQETAQDTVTKLAELLDKDDYAGFAESISINFPQVNLSDYTLSNSLRLMNNKPQAASLPGLLDDILSAGEIRLMKSRINKMTLPVITCNKTKDMLGQTWTGNRKREWTIGTEINVIK